MHGTDVDSWEELEEIIGQIRQDHKDARSSLLFRGQGNSTWPLLTTLERKSGQRFSVREYYALIHRIKDQVQTFTNTQWHVPDHDTLFKLTSEFDEFSRSLRFNGPPAYKHLVHLRHHGFPSPLLDWTSSLYVAAYFAFANPSHQTEKVSIFVYLDEPENYKHWSSGEPTITRLGPYVQTHKRHFLQKSEYTICTYYDEKPKYPCWFFVPHNMVFTNERVDFRQDVLWKYDIPVSEQVQVLKQLDEYNLNAYSLFGSEESLMETLAIRELLFHQYGGRGF